MPLYNREENRILHAMTEEEKREINPTQIVHFYHDKGIEVEETMQATNIWDPMERKIYGYLDCSNDPPFPEAYGGQMYVIDIDGTVGNYDVEKGDWIECISKYSPEGYGETIKNNWIIGNRVKEGGGTVIVGDQNDVKTQILSMTNSITFDSIPKGAILRRALVYIKSEYPEGTIFKFHIPITSQMDVEVPAYEKSVLVESLQGIVLDKETTISVSVDNYTIGNATIILEYYTETANNAVKSLRIDLSHATSSDYTIPRGAVLTSVLIVPGEDSNPEAILKLYLNDDVIVEDDLADVMLTYVHQSLTKDSKVHVELENFLRGTTSVVIEYSLQP